MIILHAKHGTVEVSDTTIRSLQAVWKTKDVPIELHKMHIWLLAHPKRRPVYWYSFLKKWMLGAPDVTPPPMPVGAGWWKSADATLETAEALGISPRPGEEMAQFRERVSKAIEASRIQH